MKRIMIALWILVGPFPAASQTKGAPQKQQLDRGKLVYQQVCLSCHQADGGGVPNMNPPLIKSTWVSGDKKKLINIVLKGFSEKIPGHYSNTMPAQNKLSDQQIADVLTFVRANFGNKASVITIPMVAAARKMK